MNSSLAEEVTRLRPLLMRELDKADFVSQREEAILRGTAREKGRRSVSRLFKSSQGK